MKNSFLRPGSVLLPALLSGALACASAFARQPARSEPSGKIDHVPYRFHHVRIEAGGFVTGVLFQPAVPGLAYLRTDIGGAYRWNGQTSRWTSLSEWIPASEDNLLGVESMAVDPAHPNDLYLAAGTYTNPGVPNGALLRSHDRGAHFEIIRLPFQLGGNEPGRFAGERLAVDPSHPGGMYLGTRNNGLWHSPDYGSTWSPVGSFPGKSTNGIGVVFAVFGPAGTEGASATTRPVYVGVSTLTGPNLYVSADDGKTWQPVQGAPSGLLPYHAAFSADGTLYATYGNAPGPNDVSSGAVWERSPSSGAAKPGHWQQITPEPTTEDPRGFGYAGLALDSLHPAIVLVSTLDRWQPGDTIFASRDHGHHWVSLTEKAVRDASASPYLVHGGKLPFGHWIGAVAIDPFDSNHVFYGTGETLWATHDLQQAWANRPTHWEVGADGIEETAVIDLLAPPAGAPLFPGLGDIGCFRADSVAANVEAAPLQPPSLSNCDAVAVAAQNPQAMAMVGRVWSGPSHGGFSMDAGKTWQPFPSEPQASQNGGSVALTGDGRTTLWTTASGTYISSDHGKQWHAFSSCGRAQVVADPQESGRVFLLPRAGGELLEAELGSAAQKRSHSRPSATSPTCEVQSTATKTLASDLPARLRMVADPMTARLWLFGPAGLYVVNRGSGSRRKLAGVGQVTAFGAGSPLSAGGPEVLYLAGQIHGESGIFRSADDGHSWKHIDDAQHGFGEITTLAADPRIAGRVYLGTNGLGVIVAEPAH